MFPRFRVDLTCELTPTYAVTLSYPPNDALMSKPSSFSQPRPFVDVSQSRASYDASPTMRDSQSSKSLFSVANFLEFIDNLMCTYVQPNIEYARSTAETMGREYGLRNVESVWNFACDAKENFSVDKTVELLIVYALRAFFLPMTIGLAISKFWFNIFATIFNFTLATSLMIFEAVVPQRIVEIVYVLDDALRGIVAFFLKCFEDFRFGKANKEQIWNRVIIATSDGVEDIQALFNDGTLVKNALVSLQIPTWLRLLKVRGVPQKCE